MHNGGHASISARAPAHLRSAGEGGEGDRLSQAVDIVIIAVILANMGAVVLESFEGLYERYAGWFAALELVSVALFTVELALRLWTCDLLRLGGRGRLQ